MLLADSNGWIRHRFSASHSVLVTFSRKPSCWMEGHDLGEPEDWYPAVAARSRRCLVSTSIAKQPKREIRPAISRLPSLPSFLRFFSANFVPLANSFALSFSLFPWLFNFHCKPRNDRHYPYRKDPGCLSKIRISEISHEEKMELTAIQ